MFKIIKTLLPFVFQVGLKLGAMGLGIFTIRWLNANLTTTEYAVYGSIMSYTSVIMGLISFGIPQITQKFFLHNTDFSQIGKFWSFVTLLRIFGLIFGCSLIFLTYKWSGSNNYFHVAGLFVSQYILLWDINYRSIADTKDKSWLFSLTDFLIKTILIGTIYSVAQPFQNLSGFIVISICTYLFGFILDSFLYRKHYTFAKTSLAVWNQHKSAIFYLSMSSLLFGFYGKTDLLFLKANNTDIVVNSYQNAYKIYELTAAVIGLIMPVIAGKIIQKQITNKKWWQCFGIVLICGICYAGIVNISAPILQQLLDSKNLYPDTVWIVRYLAVASGFMLPILFCSNTLILNGFEKFEFYTLCINASAAVSLYFLLIPRYGVMGAIWANLLVLVVDLFVKLVFIYQSKKIPKKI